MTAMTAAPDNLEIEDISLVWMWEVILIPFFSLFTKHTPD
jgi:hypothetical protein